MATKKTAATKKASRSTKKTSPTAISAADLAAATDTNRPLDGSQNNEHPGRAHWGASNTELLRLTPGADEGHHHTVPADRKVVHYWDDDNPRNISNLVCREDKSIGDPDGRTHWMWAWGQFLDHQLDLSEEGRERIEVEIDPADPHLGENKNAVISFHRTKPAAGTGIRHDQPREHTNILSAYIDASSVYGNDVERLERILGGSAPMLEMSDGDLLPHNVSGQPNAEPGDFGGPADFFLAGDVRANEHVVLTSLHTTFVRLHNVRVTELLDEGLTDSVEIFNRARAWVAAVMQVITYCEFIPELLGAEAVTGDWAYRGYDDTVETTIATEFSTAAYRLGHSMLPPTIPVDADVPGAVEVNGQFRLALEDAFFRPQLVGEKGIAVFLANLHTETMQQIDPRIATGLRNFLFRIGPNGDDLGLLDLACLNMMRGRDHRIARYNDVREGLGLERIKHFTEIGHDAVMSSRLAEAYGDVDNIDLWVGGLAESPVGGGAVGETFTTILHDQFMRLRNGDRYYWENPDHPVITEDERADLPNWTLARVLEHVGALESGFDPTINLFNTCGEHKVKTVGAGAVATTAEKMPGYHS